MVAAVSGPDFLQLDPAHAPRTGRPAWLAGRVRAAIFDGRLAAGDRLPATRTLAADLGWSRGVVVEAYQRLSEEGVVSGRSRAGTTVAAVPTAPGPSEPRREARAGIPTSGLLDLSPGVPDLALFPSAAWLRAEREILRGADGSTLRYGDPAGSGELREELARWLATNRGIRASPGDVMIVGGVAQALALISHVLRRRGHTTIAVEDPGSKGARDELTYWGLEPAGVPVDADGIDVGMLYDSGARAVVTTPAHQYPTGVVLAPHRRGALLRWAVERDAIVVEDDYDAEHRYDRTSVTALHPSAPGHVVYAGSVSKALAPSLRLGWLVAPPALRDELAQAKYATDIASPTLPQLVLSRLLRDGTYDRHLRRARRHQRQRRNAMLGHIRRYLPDADVEGVAAGLHLLVTFPHRDFDDRRASARLRADGVVVEPLTPHRLNPGTPGFILGYAAHPPGRLATAVEAMAQHLPGRAS